MWIFQDTLRKALKNDMNNVLYRKFAELRKKRINVRRNHFYCQKALTELISLFTKAKRKILVFTILVNSVMLINKSNNDYVPCFLPVV